MNHSQFKARRATLEDIEALMALWRSMDFDTEVLVKRITEFQVAETLEGQVIGAIGLQILEKQALIHSEAFADFALADALRPLLWDRLLTLANNQGLTRLWTCESAPFWRHTDLNKPDAEALEKLPGAWKARSSSWLTLKLRDELDDLLKADKEFALYMHAEKERSQRVVQRAKFLRQVATAVAFLLLFLAIGAAIYLVRNQARLALPGR